MLSRIDGWVYSTGSKTCAKSDRKAARIDFPVHRRTIDGQRILKLTIMNFLQLIQSRAGDERALAKVSRRFCRDWSQRDFNHCISRAIFNGRILATQRRFPHKPQSNFRYSFRVLAAQTLRLISLEGARSGCFGANAFSVSTLCRMTPMRLYTGSMPLKERSCERGSRS